MSGHNQEAEDLHTMATAAKCLFFGYCCCLCTAGLSCLPYWCCYHSKLEEIAIRNATSGVGAAAAAIDEAAKKEEAEANYGATGERHDATGSA